MKIKKFADLISGSPNLTEAKATSVGDVSATSIVVGSVSYEGHFIGHDTGFNGIHNKFIDLTFADLTSGKTFTTTTDNAEGVFSFVAEEEHVYQLSRIHYQTSGQYAHDVGGPLSSIYFDATSGVNNLGHLNWLLESNPNSPGTVVQEPSFKSVKDYFKSARPNSEWNAFEWHEVSVRTEKSQ